MSTRLIRVVELTLLGFHSVRVEAGVGVFVDLYHLFFCYLYHLVLLRVEGGVFDLYPLEDRHVVLLLVRFFDQCRLEDSQMTTTAAILALAALPPVLAEAAAAALLAAGALLSVLADTAAAAIFAVGAPPVMLADADATAFLAPAALPTVRTVLPVPLRHPMVEAQGRVLGGGVGGGGVGGGGVGGGGVGGGGEGEGGDGGGGEGDGGGGEGDMHPLHSRTFCSCS